VGSHLPQEIKKGDHLKNSKICRHTYVGIDFIYPCILCPLHFNPSRDLVLLIQEELENLYKIPKRGDVKFLLKSDAHKKYLDPN